jgi:hypothetical protein
MSKFTAFNLFIRQALLYPLTSPFLPPVNKVELAYSYANGTKIGTLAPAAAQLPKTGQTIEYQAGDDGTYQAGNAISPRFIDNGDGTKSDMATGLMWVEHVEAMITGPSIIPSNKIQRGREDWITEGNYLVGDVVSRDGGDAAPFFICITANNDVEWTAGKWQESIWISSAYNINSPVSFVWADGITNCEALEYAGNSDWRLPNIRELASIIDYHKTTSVAYDIFNNRNTYYWTATTYAPDDTSAWTVQFSDGTPTIDNKLYSSGNLVRPVRKII